MQPRRGIAWRAHRDDDQKRGNQSLALPLPVIESKDPHALKNTARRAEYSLTESSPSPTPEPQIPRASKKPRVRIASHLPCVKLTELFSPLPKKILRLPPPIII